MRTFFVVLVVVATAIGVLEWMASVTAGDPELNPHTTPAPPLPVAIWSATGVAADRAACPEAMRRQTATLQAAAATDEPFAALSAPSRASEVLVVDAAGNPQVGVLVGLDATELRTGRSRALPLGCTAADGILGLPPNRTGLLVVENASGRIGVVPRHESDSHVRLVLQPTGALAVDVVDAAGRPVYGADVVLLGPHGRQARVSDAAGSAVFQHLALEGPLTLRTVSAGRLDEARLPQSRPAGRTLRHVVVLAAVPNDLVATVTDGDGSPLRTRSLRCTFADGISRRIASDEHGRIRIDLPASTDAQVALQFELLDAHGRLCGPRATVQVIGNPGTTTLPNVPLTATSATAAVSAPRARPRSAFEFASGTIGFKSRP